MNYNILVILIIYHHQPINWSSTPIINNIDKDPRPDRSSLEKTRSDATKVFKHWKTTFQHLIAVFPAGTNKLEVLKNIVAPDIFDLFWQDTTYDVAMLTLTSIYVKTLNEVHTRHLLATVCENNNRENPLTLTLQPSDL